MAKPTMRDMERVKRIGRYLVGQPRARCWFRWQQSGELEAYSDADWGGDKATRGPCQLLSKEKRDSETACSQDLLVQSEQDNLGNRNKMRRATEKPEATLLTTEYLVFPISTVKLQPT